MVKWHLKINLFNDLNCKFKPELLHKIKIIILFNIVICLLSMNCSIIKNYEMTDIEIFKNTSVWELAKAIQNKDTIEMKSLILKNPSWLDFKESKFNFSLLQWSIYNSVYGPYSNNFLAETEILIRYGANPFYIVYNNKSPIKESVNSNFESEKYIKACLQSKHFNSLSDSLKRYYLGEALIEACCKIKGELKNVILLIDYGADVEYYKIDSTETPLSAALIMRNLQIAKFLLVERKVNFKGYIKSKVDNSNWYITDMIKNLRTKEDPDLIEQKKDLQKIIKNSLEEK